MNPKQNTILRSHHQSPGQIEDFQIFTLPERSAILVPTITISSEGMLLISSVLRDRSKLSQYPYCILAFSPTKRKVYFQFGVKPIEDALKVISIKGNSYRINTQSFFKYWGIDVHELEGKRRRQVKEEAVPGKGMWWSFILDEE